jgi:hypothetical protein
MFIVCSKPGGLFTSQNDVGEAGGSADGPEAYSMENLFADPEVCRRVGSIISKGAGGRRPQSHPAPRGSRSGGSTD